MCRLSVCVGWCRARRGPLLCTVGVAVLGLFSCVSPVHTGGCASVALAGGASSVGRRLCQGGFCCHRCGWMRPLWNVHRGSCFPFFVFTLFVILEVAPLLLRARSPQHHCPSFARSVLVGGARVRVARRRLALASGFLSSLSLYVCGGSSSAPPQQQQEAPHPPPKVKKSTNNKCGRYEVSAARQRCPLAQCVACEQPGLSPLRHASRDAMVLVCSSRSGDGALKARVRGRRAGWCREHSLCMLRRSAGAPRDRIARGSRHRRCQSSRERGVLPCATRFRLCVCRYMPLPCIATPPSPLASPSTPMTRHGTTKNPHAAIVGLCSPRPSRIRADPGARAACSNAPRACRRLGPYLF